MAKIVITIKRIIITMLAIATTTSTLADDTFVILNRDGTDRNLTYQDIEDVFTLRSKRWVNGAPVKVFLLPRDNSRTKEFARKYLGMSANRYYDIVEGRESSGRGNIAKVVETESSMLVKVMTTPGSVGYASESIVINLDGDLIIIK